MQLQRTLSRLVLAISAFTALLGVSGSQGHDSTSRASSDTTLKWASCGSSAPDFQCATIQAPLDYAKPKADTITLAVIRHQATDPALRIGTLFFNPGGPGGAGTTELPAFFSQFPDAAVSHFDIVSWDPRGVGLSTALQCFPNQAAETAFFAGVPSDSFPISAVEQTGWISRFAAFDSICGQRQGNLLAHVSTTDTARDMDLLRQAVGDSTLTYLGISYGTYLGAVYANLFPGKVRAMILDGVVDPVAYNADGDGKPRLSTGQRIGSDIGAAESLSAFLDQCGEIGPAACIFSTGDAAGTHARFDNMLHRLEVAPVTYKGFVFTPALLLTTVGDGLFFTRPVPQVAAGWVGLATALNDIWNLTEQSTAANENAQPATANDSTPPPDTEEKYTSPFQQAAVECPESPNPRPAKVFRKLARITAARAGVVGLLTPWTDEVCADWPAVAADNYKGPWSNPTANTILVIGNTHDPSTPYADAVALSGELANSRLLTVDGYGHTALLNASACASQYEGEYLVTGTLPPVGTICAQTASPF